MKSVMIEYLSAQDIAKLCRTKKEYEGICRDKRTWEYLLKRDFGIADSKDARIEFEAIVRIREWKKLAEERNEKNSDWKRFSLCGCPECFESTRKFKKETSGKIKDKYLCSECEKYFDSFDIKCCNYHGCEQVFCESCFRKHSCITRGYHDPDPMLMGNPCGCPKCFEANWEEKKEMIRKIDGEKKYRMQDRKKREWDNTVAGKCFRCKTSMSNKEKRDCHVCQQMYCGDCYHDSWKDWKNEYTCNGIKKSEQESKFPIAFRMMYAFKTIGKCDPVCKKESSCRCYNCLFESVRKITLE